MPPLGYHAGARHRCPTPPPPARLQAELGGSRVGLDSESERPAVKAKPRVEKNRVLVTGGAGFVGSHLCDYLVARGDHVSEWTGQWHAGWWAPSLRCCWSAAV